MDLKTSGNRSNRLIKHGSYTKKGNRLSSKMLNKIHNSPLRATEHTFNSIPRKLRNMTGVTLDTFKRHLDRWMLRVPDQPKCNGYVKFVKARSNALCDQVMVRW